MLKLKPQGSFRNHLNKMGLRAPHFVKIAYKQLTINLGTIC